MHILVIGATGRNGSLAVQEALSRGHTVTALVRSPSTSSLPSHANLNLIQGTPTSQTDVLVALTSSHQPPQAIITALAQARTSESPFAPLRKDTSPYFLSESMHTLIAAIMEAKLPLQPKIIVNSAQGVGTSWRSMNLPGKMIFSHGSMGTGLKDHNKVDRLVRESGLPFVLGRPCMLAEGQAQEVKVWPDNGDGCAWIPKITRASVGKWLIDAADSSQWDGTAPVLSN